MQNLLKEQIYRTLGFRVISRLPRLPLRKLLRFQHCVLWALRIYEVFLHLCSASSLHSMTLLTLSFHLSIQIYSWMNLLPPWSHSIGSANIWYVLHFFPLPSLLGISLDAPRKFKTVGRKQQVCSAKNSSHSSLLNDVIEFKETSGGVVSEIVDWQYFSPKFSGRDINCIFWRLLISVVPYDKWFVGVWNNALQLR